MAVNKKTTSNGRSRNGVGTSLSAVAESPIYQPSDRKLEAGAATEHYVVVPYGPAMLPYANRPYFTLLQQESMLWDQQVWFGLQLGNAPLMGAKVEVVGPSKEINAFVQAEWERLWNENASKIVATKYFGFAGFEVQYRRNPVSNLWEIKGLRDFHPRDVRPLLQKGGTAGGDIAGVAVYGQRSHLQEPTITNPTRLFGMQGLWLGYQNRFCSNFGRSLTEKAYPAWWDKAMPGGGYDMRRLRAIKDAWIGDVLKYPSKMTFTLPTGELVSAKDIAREIMENRVSGGVIAIPSDCDPNTNMPYFEYQPPTVVAPSEVVKQWIDDSDWDIFDGLLVPKEVVEAAESGSGYSGRSIPMLMFLGLRETEFRDYVKPIKTQVFEPLVVRNFGRHANDFEIQPIPFVDQFTDQVGGGAEGGPVGGSGAGGGGQHGPGSPDGRPEPPGANGKAPEQIQFGAYDQIPGGKSQGKVPGDFDAEQLAIGLKVEMEHTTDPKIALEIAMDHLTEDPEYYRKLATIDEGAADAEKRHLFPSSSVNSWPAISAPPDFPVQMGAWDDEPSDDRPSGMRWVTLESGQHVLIDDNGNVHAGHKAHVGKNLAGAKTAPRPERPKFNPRNKFDAEVTRTAGDYGIDPHELRETAEHMHDEIKRTHGERERAKIAARKTTGLFPGTVQALQNAGHDYTSGNKVGGNVGKMLQNFDVAAHSVARENPDIGLPDPNDPHADFAAAVWELLSEGRRPVPLKEDPDLIRKAADLLYYGRDGYRKPAAKAEREPEAVPFGLDFDAIQFGQGLLWDEALHPRDADGKFRETYTMSRGKFHQQEREKPGYDVGETNRKYKAALQSAIEAGKPVDPILLEEFPDLQKLAAEKAKPAAAPEPAKPAEKPIPKVSDETRERLKNRNKRETAFRQKLVDWSEESIKANKVTRERAARHLKTIDEVMGYMSDKAQELLIQNTNKINFYNTTTNLKGAHNKISRHKLKKNDVLGGFWAWKRSQPGGELYLDGGYDTGEPNNLNQREIYAHEMAHAVDSHYALSGRNEWSDAWKAEIDKEGSPLSRYARQDRIEGFAEFGRLVFTRPKEAREMFPQCWAAWQTLELI